MSFKVKALDGVKEISNKKIGLIKIDVEGHELFAFRGMVNILKKRKPIVIFEQHEGIYNGTSDVIKFLFSLGYKNLYEVRRNQYWFVPDLRWKPINTLLRLFEVLILGYPIKKCELLPIKKLNNKAYDMLVMTK